MCRIEMTPRPGSGQGTDPEDAIFLWAPRAVASSRFGSTLESFGTESELSMARNKAWLPGSQSNPVPRYIVVRIRRSRDKCVRTGSGGRAGEDGPGLDGTFVLRHCM